MKDKKMLTIAMSAAVLAVAGGLAIYAQDKYTVKVPGGLAFSEFRGYETWQAISISRNERVVAVILGNPAMIDAYRAGIPGQRQACPGRGQDGQDPLDPETKRVLPGRDGAGQAAERRLHGEGQQEVRG